MLETGLQAKNLLVGACEKDTAPALATELMDWFKDKDVLIYDLQFFKTNDKWVALAVYRQ